MASVIAASSVHPASAASRSMPFNAVSVKAALRWFFQSFQSWSQNPSGFAAETLLRFPFNTLVLNSVSVSVSWPVTETFRSRFIALRCCFSLYFFTLFVLLSLLYCSSSQATGDRFSSTKSTSCKRLPISSNSRNWTPNLTAILRERRLSFGVSIRPSAFKQHSATKCQRSSKASNRSFSSSTIRWYNRNHCNPLIAKCLARWFCGVYNSSYAVLP